MPEKIKIHAELEITPGGGSTQNKLRLSACGETVFDEYESSIDEDIRRLLGEIVAAHARALGKFSQDLKLKAADANPPNKPINEGVNCE